MHVRMDMNVTHKQNINIAAMHMVRWLQHMTWISNDPLLECFCYCLLNEVSYCVSVETLSLLTRGVATASGWGREEREEQSPLFGK